MEFPQYEGNYVPRSKRRNKKKGSSRFLVVCALLSCVLIAILICSSSVGSFISEKIFRPMWDFVLGKDAENDKIVSALSDQEASASASPSAATASDEVTQTIELPQQVYYLLQMESYDNETAAFNAATLYRAMGAAGYVMADGATYRILAAAYMDSDSLTKVKEQVSGDGYLCSSYVITGNKLSVSVTSDKEDVETLQELYLSLIDLPKRVSELVLALDRKETDVAALRSELSLSAQDLESSLNAIKTYTALKDVYDALSDYKLYLSTFLADSATMDNDECGVLLKYAQIEMMLRYVAFTQSTNGI